MVLSDKNILYISYDGMTDPLGQSQVIPYVQGLSIEGYKFTLLSCEKRDRFEENKHIVAKILQDSDIEWVPIFYHKKPAVLSTIFDTYSLQKEAEALHKIKKFKLVHCRSYISSLIGLLLYKKYKLPFIFDMRGFYADERVDGGLWALSNPLYHLIYKFFKRKEKEFLQYASVTISLTEAGKGVMQEWGVVKKNKTRIEVIPCSADFHHFNISSSEEKKEFRLALEIKETTFILNYLGSIGTWYMLDEMMDFFIVLQKKYEAALFYIITPDDPEPIKLRAKAKGISGNKIRIEFSQRAELAKKLSISDASIFFIKPCFSKLSSSPTKLGELLAMGIPVICNEGIGDVKEIIDMTEGGLTVNTFTANSYEKIIAQLASFKNGDVHKVRLKAQVYYDLGKAVKKYSEIYSSILS